MATASEVIAQDREKKLEAMARAWCEFNGWVPDHRPLTMKVKRREKYQPLDITEEPGEPIWKAHVRGMDAVLRAIEQK